MEKQRVDRRVQRTHQLLHDALLELILEKGYEAVTVQDILDRANLGRSTFSAHYRDKEDLLLSGFGHLRETFEEDHRAMSSGKSKSNGSDFNPSLAFFQHAGQQRRLYKAMVGKQGSEIIQRFLHKYFSDLMREHLNSLVPDEKALTLPLDVVVHYLVSSFLALVTWWLDHNLYRMSYIN